MAHNYLEVDISRLSGNLKLSCALLGNISPDSYTSSYFQNGKRVITTKSL